MAKIENKVRELSASFSLAISCFKNHFRCLGRRGVEQHDACKVLSERLCDAGELLGHHQNADADMSSRKAKIHQLACAPFHIFGGCAVIEHYERVGALEKPSHELQAYFHLVLLAYYHKYSWIIFTNSAVRHV